MLDVVDLGQDEGWYNCQMVLSGGYQGMCLNLIQTEGISLNTTIPYNNITNKCFVTAEDE